MDITPEVKSKFDEIDTAYNKVETESENVTDEAVLELFNWVSDLLIEKIKNLKEKGKEVSLTFVKKHQSPKLFFLDFINVGHESTKETDNGTIYKMVELFNKGKNTRASAESERCPDGKMTITITYTSPINTPDVTR